MVIVKRYAYRSARNKGIKIRVPVVREVENLFAKLTEDQPCNQVGYLVTMDDEPIYVGVKRFRQFFVLFTDGWMWFSTDFEEINW